MYGFLPGPHGQFVSVTYPRRTDCASVCFIFRSKWQFLGVYIKCCKQRQITTTATKTSPGNIISFVLLRDYFNSLHFYKMTNYPGTKLVGLEYKLREKMKNSLSCVPVLHKLNLECGHFTLLFCRGRQTNAPKCKTHVQSDCICSLNLLFCSVVVAVVFA